MNQQLSGRRALVCGASGGIGLACAEALASQGAEVTLVARNEKELQRVISNLAKIDSSDHSFVVADLGQVQETAALIEALVSQRGAFQILVNNAGGPPGGPLFDANPEQLITGLTPHLFIAHRLVQILVPGMKESGDGRILNIISTSVKQPIAGLGVSNTVRGAMANWAKTLAGELGKFGITVNNVLPGATKTTRLEALVKSKSEKTGQSIEDVERTMIAAIPMGRFAEASEVAGAVAFLAGPGGAYITGINLPVDGGRLACL